MIREAYQNDIDSIANIMVSVWKTSYKGVIDDDFLAKQTVEDIIHSINAVFSFGNYFVFEENKVIK